MKNCIKCGAVNPDEINACQRCGAPLPPTTGRLCPKGIHIMDPAWTECEYCFPRSAAAPQGFSADSQRRMTVVEAPPPDPAQGIGQLPPRIGSWQSGGTAEHRPLPPRSYEARPVPGGLQRPTPQPPPPPPQQQPWQVEESRHSTRIARPDLPGSPPSISSDPRIVGVLVTYSWIPSGQIFPLLEGRNRIGRGKCEISIPNDLTMSMENSSITFRETFMLRDRDSTSGTYLNGQAVEEQARLSNYAQIRAGSTVFIFVALDPAYLRSSSNTGNTPVTGT